MRTTTTTIAFAISVAVALAGCGFLVVDPSPTPLPVTHADPYPANPTGEWDAVLVVAAADTADLEAISVDDALTHAGGGELLLVHGALFVDDAYGQVWLCGRVQPDGDAGGPRCGGSVLLIQDEAAGRGMLASEYISSLVEAASVGELRVAGTVRWSAEAAFIGRIR